MVVGNLPGAAAANQVAAGVADVRDDGPVVAQRAGHHGGGHHPVLVFLFQGAIVNCDIGLLDQARQQADQPGAGMCLGELIDKH